MVRCPFCSSTDVVSTPQGVVCASCGEIVEDAPLVFEGGFQASAPAGGGQQVWSRGWPRHVSHNTELAQRGQRELSRIADQMQLSQQIQEAGKRMYQLAIQMDFNYGRPQNLVATACLYVVCRRNRSPYMLLDFADVLNKPVKTIGQCYMRLLRRLVGGDPRNDYAPSGFNPEELPIIDPSIYLERFSQKLSLGGMTRRVQDTAGKLIQFMHRDWICLGRRPNGLCGAALLIASYFHGQECTAQDISDVVRIGECTLRQRLFELKYTPLGSMGKIEFAKAAIKRGPDCIVTGDAPAFEAIPPCLRKSRRKDHLVALMDAEQAKELEIGKALLDGRPLDALTDSPRRGAAAAADSAAMPPPSSGPRRGKRKNAGENAPADAAEGVKGGKLAAPGEGEGVLALLGRARAEKFTKTDPSTQDIEEIGRSMASELQIVGLGILDQPAQASSGAASLSAAAAARIGQIVESRPDAAKAPSEGGDAAPLRDVASPSPAGGACASEQGGAPKSLMDGHEEGDEEELSDVDDEELDAYLLDRAEGQAKSDIWHEVNKGYLQEWHERGREAKSKKQRSAAGSQNSQASASGSRAGSEAGDTGSDAGSHSRRSSGRQSGTRTQRSTPTESALVGLAKKRVSSSRINLEALESLFE